MTHRFGERVKKFELVGSNLLLLQIRWMKRLKNKNDSFLLLVAILDEFLNQRLPEKGKKID